VHAAPKSAAFDDLESVPMAYSARERAESESPSRVLILDSGATVHLFRDGDLASNVTDLESPITVATIGKFGIAATRQGTYLSFGQVLISHEAAANVLSLGQLEEKNLVFYSPTDKAYIAESSEHRLEFRKSGRLYLLHRVIPLSKKKRGQSVHHSLLTTVESNLASLTKVEQAKAKAAKHILELLAHPSLSDMSAILRHDTISGIPAVSSDFDLANRVFGPNIGTLMGKTVASTPLLVGPRVDTTSPRSITLHADIMHVDSAPYLITVSSQINMVIVTVLAGRDSDSLMDAIITQVNIYKSHKWQPGVILVDGETEFQNCIPALNAEHILVNTASASQHVPVIERKIRLVKERVRAIYNSLPFLLPPSWMQYLVGFCVSRLNLLPFGDDLKASNGYQAVIFSRS